MTSGLLDGIKVVDITHMLAGPYCAQWLGDLGADVIKVEATGQGDRSRHSAPSIMKDGKIGYGFLAVNRNKRGISVNLSTEEGRNIIYKLVEQADVFLVNLRATTVKKLGLSYEELRRINPKLVYASITGFGDKGPYKDLPGQDLQIQAMTGLMSITGYKDRTSVPAGEAIADAVTGIQTAFGVLAALYARHDSGVGQEVKTSLFACLLGLFPQQVAFYMGNHLISPKAETGSTHSTPRHPTASGGPRMTRRWPSPPGGMSPGKGSARAPAGPTCWKTPNLKAVTSAGTIGRSLKTSSRT